MKSTWGPHRSAHDVTLSPLPLRQVRSYACSLGYAAADELMSVKQLVLVIGGTRGTGLLIAQRLQHQGVPVRILARNPVGARARLGPTFHLIAGDITQQETIPRALEGTTHVVFTAGWRSGRPAMERHIRETEYGGVVNTLAAAQRVGFGGRFLYMTASSVTSRSWATVLLNLYKGNTLVWRERAEHEIRGSGLEYTIRSEEHTSELQSRQYLVCR